MNLDKIIEMYGIPVAILVYGGWFINKHIVPLIGVIAKTHMDFVEGIKLSNEACRAEHRQILDSIEKLCDAIKKKGAA